MYNYKLVIIVLLIFCLSIFYSIQSMQHDSFAELIDAIKQNDLESVKQFDQQIFSQKTEDSQRTPLHIAVQSDSTDHPLVALLINEFGQNVNARDRNGKMPLHLIVHNTATSEPSATDDLTLKQQPPFLRSIEKALLLINAGAALNTTDKFGHTVLEYTVLRGQVKLVNFLIGQGALVTPQAVEMAASREEFELADVLAKYSYKNYKLNTIFFKRPFLHFAVLNRLTFFIQHWLEDNHENPTVTDDDGQTPLLLSLKRHDFKTADIIVRSMQGNVNQADKKLTTALHIAAKYANDQFVKLLLEQGADPNAADCMGKTPLSYANELTYNTEEEESIRREIIERLIKAGAKKEVVNANDAALKAHAIIDLDLFLAETLNQQAEEAALDPAAKRRASNRNRLQMQSPASPPASLSPVYYNIDFRQERLPGPTHKPVVTQRLIFQDHQTGCRTKLHEVMSRDGNSVKAYNKQDAIKALKESAIDAQDPLGNSPLHYAIVNWQRVKFLLDNGANPTLRNNQGFTPRDLLGDQTGEAFFNLKAAESHWMVTHNTDIQPAPRVQQASAVQAAIMSAIHPQPQVVFNVAIHDQLIQTQPIAPQQPWQTPIISAANQPVSSTSDQAIPEEILVRQDLPFLQKIIQEEVNPQDFQQLLENGFIEYVDFPDSNGNTPLHYAAQFSRDDIIEILLTHGANATAINQQGYLPVSYANPQSRSFQLLSNNISLHC